MNTFLSAHKEHIETYHIYMRKSKWCGGGLGPVSDPGLLSCYCHIHHYHHRHPFLLPSHCHPCLFVIIIILGLLVWVRFSTILQNKILQKHIQHKVLNWDALNFSAWLLKQEIYIGQKDWQVLLWICCWHLSVKQSGGGVSLWGGVALAAHPSIF